MNIGERIKKRRDELNLTLEDVGRAVGVNRSTVKRYESGQTHRIPFETMERLAVVLKTTPEYLQGLDESNAETVPMLDDEVMMIARDMKNLPKDKLDMLKKIVSAMSDTADRKLDDK